MFIQNKYLKIYRSLIDRASSRNLVGYCERHHIVPRSLGGSDDARNIVHLTAREHFIAHLLLIRMTSGVDKRKMVYAVVCFNRPNPNHIGRFKLNSRSYENVKKLLSSLPVSPETGRKISQALKGRKRSPEVCKAIGDAHRGKFMSTETRAKQSAAKRGIIPSAETRVKMSLARKGKLFSETHCLNISKAYKKSDARTAAIIEANKAKRRSCTVDGVKIYPSKRALEEELGRGKLGSRSPTFRFVEK